MRGNSFARGTSVIAALVLVAILVTVAGLVKLASPSPSVASQSAAVSSCFCFMAEGCPCARINEAMAEALVQKHCAKELEEAKKKFKESDAEEDAQDHCVAAMYVSNNPEQYRCVGKTARVSVIAESGDVQIKSEPNKDIAPGTCKTIACSGGDTKNCIAAEMNGISSRSIANAFQNNLPSTAVTKLTSEALPGFKGGLPVEQDPLKTLEQFNTAEALGKKQTELASAQQQIREYAEGCGLTECSAGDTKALEQLRAQETKLKAEQDNLQKQMTTLAQADRGTITPPPGSGPGGKTPPPTTGKNPGDCPGAGPAVCNLRPTFTPPPASGYPNQDGVPSGLLAALMRPQPPPPPPPPQQQQTCSSNPTAQSQQQQQYQYQLQRYQYEQQMGFAGIGGLGGYGQYSSYGYPGVPPYGYGFGGYGQGNFGSPFMAPIAPQPCAPGTGTGTGTGTGSPTQCPVEPPQPSPDQCRGGMWQPQRTRLQSGIECTVGWQCSAQTPTKPTAELACEPKVADIGMSVAITYSCGGSTTSTGTGFSTGGKLSGATTATIDGSGDAQSISFALSCTKEGQSATAECTIEINKPTIVLIANPESVQRGKTSTIGWTTTGMRSCRIASPDYPEFTAEHESNTSVNGAAETPSIQSPARFVLSCETFGGAKKEATATVSISETDGITIKTSVDGKIAVQLGEAVDVTWSVGEYPPDSAMSLWLYDTEAKRVVGLIREKASPLGALTWTIPAVDDCPCASKISQKARNTHWRLRSTHRRMHMWRVRAATDREMQNTSAQPFRSPSRSNDLGAVHK